MSPKISVIIVNYNAGFDLIKCVESVAKAAIDLELIVVDNNSHDQSIERLHLGYKGNKDLHVVKNKTNLGFAVGCNQGSSAALGDFFLYLNPDCIVTPETIQALVKCIQSDPLIGMTGGLILNHDGSEQRGCRRKIPTPWSSIVNSFGLRKLAPLNRKAFSDFRLDLGPLPNEPVAVDAISGACMLVSREAYADVGPMDEEYFLHCEDLDWCMRFRQSGWKIMFVPAAKLYHNKGTCSTSRPVFVEWSKHKGMVRFYKKFYTEKYPVVMLYIVWCGVWLRFGLTLAKYYFSRFLMMVRQGD